MDGDLRTVTVLGGYGRVGRGLTELLARAGFRVVVAGRRLDQAERWRFELARRVNSSAVLAKRVDLSSLPSTSAAIAESDLVVVAAPVQEHLGVIARACLDTTCDCLDIVPSTRVSPELEALAAEARGRGRLFVTQAGCCPGLPGALARILGARHEEGLVIRVGIALSLRDASRPEEVYDIIDASVDNSPQVFRSGSWRRVPLTRERRSFEYGAGFGRRISLPLDLPELHGVAEELQLAELGAYGATPAWRLDVVTRAVMRRLYSVRRGLGRRRLASALVALANRSTNPSGVSVVAEATTESQGPSQSRAIRIAHDEVSMSTAIVVAVFIRRYMAGLYRQLAGLKTMGELLADETALDDMARLGMHVSRFPVIALSALMGA